MTILIGDCREQMKGLADASIDAIVTDPPYELGFMGKKWDASGIAYDSVVWTEALRVLKPGGHLLAFGGTRTSHRMVCAIEDAGFEIRDSLVWMYGSGFPKSLNLHGDREGWGTALKPAHEPIVLARKPLIGTVAANVLAHGTGAINVDGCRIETDWASEPGRGEAWLKSGRDAKGHDRPAQVPDNKRGSTVADRVSPLGRWPANVLLDETAAALLDEQSGNRQSGSRRNGDYKGMGYHGSESWQMPAVSGSSGGASRFFYCAKASRSERGAANIHPTVKPIALMRYLVRLVTPPGGLVLDPFMGSGTTGIAAKLEGFRFIGIEQSEEYAVIARGRIAADSPLFAGACA